MKPMREHLEPFLPQTASQGWRSLLIPAVLCVLFFLNGLNNTFQNSAVSDEVGGHMASGYLYWLSGQYSGGIANYPLAHLVIALPVVMLGYSYELFTEQHLVLFRLPVLLMGVLLGIILYRFTVGLLGRIAGVAALFLFSFSPNVIAHASLATLDLPITFFVFVTIYALWSYLKRPHWARMLVLSLALACALTTKVQALLLVPLVLLILAVSGGHRVLRRKQSPGFLWWWMLVPLVFWIVVNVVYLNLPVDRAHLLPPLFVAALQAKLTHAMGRLSGLQVAYLLGHYSADGWWWYFPFAILVKTPLPTLVLLGLGLLRRPTWWSLSLVLLPAAAFLGMAMEARLNIGLRHVLIIYPFLFMLAGQGAARLWSHRWGGVMLVVLASGYMWQAAAIAPHHLSYFNMLAGGTRNGHHLLIGANYDFGQNDRFLRRYVEERGIDYKINPGPFRPTTGHILVNANAFYGSYGSGGPAAYAWLKELQPVNQIAYTWFEYEVREEAQAKLEEVVKEVDFVGQRHPFRPWNVNNVAPQQLDAALEEIQRHLQALRSRYADITEPQFRLTLAEALVAAAAYGGALEEARLLLEQDPGFEPALGLGGELMVCWKVGILKFEGHEYLTGFGAELGNDARALPDIASITYHARIAGISALLSRLHYRLGSALEELGRTAEAFQQYRVAVWICSPTAEGADVPAGS